MSNEIRVKVWAEYRHERQPGKPQEIYPKGMHNAIADYLKKQPGMNVSTATLDEPEHGLTEDALSKTDVLIWWGHMAHGEVKDEIVDRVRWAVLGGMGLIVLHSGHFSKIFKALMGTGCDLRWREIGEKERIWVIDPSHPITDVRRAVRHSCPG
jgi:trehalose utilization protein